MAQLEFNRRPNGLGTKKTWNTKPRDWTDRRPHRLVLDRKLFLVKVKSRLCLITVFSESARVYSPDYMIFMRSRGCAVQY